MTKSRAIEEAHAPAWLDRLARRVGDHVDGAAELTGPRRGSSCGAGCWWVYWQRRPAPGRSDSHPPEAGVEWNLVFMGAIALAVLIGLLV